MTSSETSNTGAEQTIASLQALLAELKNRGLKVEFRKNERKHSTSRALVISGSLRLLTESDKSRLSTLLGMLYTVVKTEVIESSDVDTQELLMYHLEPQLKK